MRFAPRPLDRRSAALALALVLPVGALAACGGDDGSDGAADDPTTTVAPDGSGGSGGSDEDTTTTAAETTTTVAEAEGGGDLAGDWTADASDILVSNLANLGGGAGISCTGPITLSFGDDGTFTQQGEATCTGPGGISGTATFQTTGSYATDGDTVTVSGAVNEGTMDLMGTSQPIAGIGDGQATYEVSGDTLTITFENATVGTVSQTYARA